MKEPTRHERGGWCVSKAIEVWRFESGIEERKKRCDWLTRMAYGAGNSWAGRKDLLET